MHLRFRLSSLPLLAMAAVGLAALPALGQTATANLSITVPTAVEISITNAGNPIVLSQGAGDTFTTPWTSPAPGSTVTFSYRDKKAGAGVSIVLSATNLVAAGGSTPPALSTITAQATKGSITTGTLTTTPLALGTSTTPSAANTVFSDVGGSHALGQSFTEVYSMAAGDYPADTYTTTVTYTISAT